MPHLSMCNHDRSPQSGMQLWFAISNSCGAVKPAWPWRLVTGQHIFLFQILHKVFLGSPSEQADLHKNSMNNHSSNLNIPSQDLQSRRQLIQTMRKQAWYLFVKAQSRGHAWNARQEASWSSEGNSPATVKTSQGEQECLTGSHLPALGSNLGR